MIFFSADFHWGHDKIREYCGRPFDDIYHMREVLVSRWNEVVSEDDIVYILGDWAMGNRSESLQVSERLAGTKILISGNHDKTFKEGTSDAIIEQYLDSGIHTVFPSQTIELALYDLDDTILLNHFPYDGDSRERDRYTEYRPQNEGKWLVHGHIHERRRILDRQINVGVDAWAGYPVSEKTIIDIITANPYGYDSEVPPLDWGV